MYVSKNDILHKRIPSNPKIMAACAELRMKHECLWKLSAEDFDKVVHLALKIDVYYGNIGTPVSPNDPRFPRSEKRDRRINNF